MAEMVEMADNKKISKEVLRISSQANDIFRCKGCLWDTYFYKVVLAGNVKVIKQVVAHLRSRGSVETLDWLFQRNEFEETRHVKKRKSKKLLIKRVAMFFLLSLVSLLLTPVFYALHILATSFLNRKQRRISTNIKLPLAYAAFSQNKEMVAFFMNQGADISHIDKRGNNIFHYIADLSAAAANNAMAIFCSLVDETADIDSVKKLIEHDRNSDGLTAVEYAAKFGSPSLLAKILKQPNLLHHTLFFASEDRVAFNKQNEPASKATEHDATTRVEFVDVSMYEAGTIMDQSTLLNILSDRDIAGMSSTDLHVFSQGQFISQWVMLKCKQMAPGVAVVQVIDFIITCVMVYLLSISFVGQNGPTFFSWLYGETRKLQVNELKALSENTSSILKPQAFHDAINKQRLHLQQKWLRDLWLEDDENVQQLLNITSLKIFQDANISLDAFTEDSFHLLNDEAMDFIYGKVRIMPQFENSTRSIETIRQYPQVVMKFAEELHKRRSEYMEEHDMLDDMLDKIKPIYENFSIEDNGILIKPNPAITIEEFFNAVCHPLRKFRLEDLNVAPSSSISFVFSHMHKYYHTCHFQTLLKLDEMQLCANFDLGTLVKIATAKNYSTPRIIELLIVFVYAYIVLDCVERCAFVSRSVVYQTNPGDMVFAALGQKVPGSYMRKQLNIISCMAVMLQFYVHKYNIRGFHTETSFTNFLAIESVAAMMFIVAIVIRFLMHIHSLRLVPGIGHFVITTFMMGTNLLHFSAVFGIVVLIFSMLFHILIDDPNCPLEKSIGFITVMESIFSTFKLTFGHGEMDEYFSSAPVQLTYVLFVIIVVLLLLNLIIAIMSTTATDIMAEPWREVLWKIEWLDEATSVEYTFSVITLPFRKLRGFGYFFHQKAGFIVKRNPTGKHAIHIECFHCPAMQIQEFGQDTE